jgi:hypothetical protein
LQFELCQRPANRQAGMSISLLYHAVGNRGYGHPRADRRPAAIDKMGELWITHPPRVAWTQTTAARSQISEEG